ncbi:MAG: metallophosphoesterase [Agathobacter sp.]|nr:metallophosphoesterase [Agathobacter sp.]
MKKKFISILLIVLLLALIGFGGGILYRTIQKQTQSPISMIVASDIHYLSPEYRGEYFKEPSSYFDGKLTHYSPEYFEAFLSEVMEKKPKILLISGDITLNGAKKSHEEVSAKLKKVQDMGIQVLVIPGNHDVDSVGGDYTPEEPIGVEGTTLETFLTLYEDFGPAQALSRDAKTFSYVYEASPFLRILMVDANCPGKGTVQDDTLLWIEKQLKSAKLEGADVIAVSHQNLYAHSKLLYFGYQLYNYEKLLALYEKYDVKLNLSGHIHVQSIVSEETTPETTIPEIAVGSLAVCGTPYGEITYDGTSISYHTTKTDVSSYALKQGWANENLLNFNNFSYYYFEEVGRLQVRSKYTDSTLSLQEVALLADTFAKINSSYFTGEHIDTDALKDGIDLWETQKDGFFYNYIQSMLDENEVDNQSFQWKK